MTAAAIRPGDPVRVTATFNPAATGRRAEVVEVLADGRVVVRLDKIRPGHMPPDGLMWLRPEEVEAW